MTDVEIKKDIEQQPKEEKVFSKRDQNQKPKRDYKNFSQNKDNRNRKTPGGKFGAATGREEFKSETLEVKRVQKTTTGGRRLSYSALVAIGNCQGMIGIGKGKDVEVSGAINKALNNAHKKLIRVPRYQNTIVHDVIGKFGATKILFKKARKGTGCISCNLIKIIMRLAGIRDVVSKVIGSSNLNNIIHATLEAISQLETPKSIALRRGRSLDSILGYSVQNENKRKIKVSEI